MKTMGSYGNADVQPMSVRKALAGYAAALLLGSGMTIAAIAQEWDSVVGAVTQAPEPTEHWFAATGDDIGYVVDADSGTVHGTLTLSMFTPALRPQIDKGLIHAYGSFYSRTYYGDRTDVLISFDAKTMAPVNEVEIPAKSAGIGHSGMIGLVDGQFIGVWNITPAMSVSVVDVQNNTFVGEISTPGCAAVYPLGSGFLMPCGDGTLQYIELNKQGAEASRTRSSSFFDVEDDPIFDYAVPSAEGWLFMTLDGEVFEATLNAKGRIDVSKPWSIIEVVNDNAQGTIADAGEWRIGGHQPFAYNAQNDLLVTLMHNGGGQETFEDAGWEIWAFDLSAKRRGYQLTLDEQDKSNGVQLTQDAAPLLLVSPAWGGDTVRVYDALTGKHQRTITELKVNLVQNL